MGACVLAHCSGPVFWQGHGGVCHLSITKSTSSSVGVRRPSSKKVSSCFSWSRSSEEVPSVSKKLKLALILA